MSKEESKRNLGGFPTRGKEGKFDDSLTGGLVRPGIILFLDQLILAISNWVYWLVVSMFAGASDIGNATSIISLVLLVNSVTQLGLEYPLLKRARTEGSRILGTMLIIELSIVVASIPAFVIFSSNLFSDSGSFTVIALAILLLSSVGFVARFTLLGIAKTRFILLFDLLGTGLKLATGVYFVSTGYGSVGILLSFLLQAIVVSCGTIVIAGRSFRPRIGKKDFAKALLKDGLVNMPSKFSGVVIVSLTVVMLALIGIDSSQIGIFYIAMMISIVIGSFAANLALMSIPASSDTGDDLSLGSLRIGLAFTGPIISVLLVAPEAVLSIFGMAYSQAANVLTILAVAILPSVVLANGMSKFNNLNRSKVLITMGCVRLISFIISFEALVPLYGILGAAYAIFISSVSSAIVSAFFSERLTTKYILLSILSLLPAIGAGQLLQRIMVNDVISILITAGISIGMMFALKLISLRELSVITASVMRK